MTERDWEYTPISAHHFGDQGPWTWEVPTLWRGLADPDGPWAPPPPPWRGEDDLATRIAFWAPLLTLTYGVLGWPRPEVGVQRWVEAGCPDEDAALNLLNRWWGRDVLGLTAWAQRSQQIEHYSHAIASATATTLGPTTPMPRVESEERWHLAADGGGDPLHLGHVLDHLLGGPEFGGLPPLTGRIIHDPPTAPQREASLLLDRYAGWYGTLARLGAHLPDRPDGRSWQVHVTVAPLGHLGTYRRSRVTGRWFAGRHKWHMLGWTG